MRRNQSFVPVVKISVKAGTKFCYSKIIHNNRASFYKFTYHEHLLTTSSFLSKVLNLFTCECGSLCFILKTRTYRTLTSMQSPFHPSCIRTSVPRIRETDQTKNRPRGQINMGRLLAAQNMLRVKLLIIFEKFFCVFVSSHSSFRREPYYVRSGNIA